MADVDKILEILLVLVNNVVLLKDTVVEVAPTH
jgi:hypothetical protein